MRFGVAHRVLVTAVATFGVVGLASAMPVVPAALLVASTAAALSLPEAFRASVRARYVAATFAFVVVVAALARIGRAPMLELAMEVVLAMQVVRLATRRGASHDLQIVALAVAQLLLGAGSVAHAICVLGFLLAAPGALTLSQLRREVESNHDAGARDRTGSRVDVARILRSRRVVGGRFLALVCVASMPVLVVGALSTMLVPHSGGAGRATGFDGSLDLSGIGTIARDPAIVLRWKPPSGSAKSRDFLKLRGTAFDRYEAGRWLRSNEEAVPFVAAKGERTIAIELEAMEPRVLFVPSDTVGIRFDGELTVDRESTYTYGGPARTSSYEVLIGSPLEAPLSEADRARYLQLPGDASRIAELVRTLTRGAKTDEERARRLLDYLQGGGGFRYTLDQPSGAAANPIDHFLFTSRAGHCAYFSTAMTLMLRSVGIPSRNVTGFAGASYNRFDGRYVVRRSDAHSWVEAYLGSRWTTLDPTPGASSEPEVANPLRDACEALAVRWRHAMPKAPRLGSMTPMFALCVVMLACVALAFRRASFETPREVPDVATDLWLSLERALAARGITRPADVPPLRFAEQLVASRGDALSEEVLALANRYTEARFGRRPLAAGERAEFARRVRGIRAG
jgi:transglutaminase-like putative cysteine protease